MDKDWFLIGVPFLLSSVTLIAGYYAGQRGRSIAIATTVDKEWLQTIAEDLAEFVELQIDIVWKRWRLIVMEGTDPETSSTSYEKEAFRFLQEASWRQTFRSDLLRSKLLLMLDHRDTLQENLIAAIDEYAKHVIRMETCLEIVEKEVPKQLGSVRDVELCKIRDEFDQRLRQNKPQILKAGRVVLADKREAIRQSV